MLLNKSLQPSIYHTQIHNHTHTHKHTYMQTHTYIHLHIYIYIYINSEYIYCVCTTYTLFIHTSIHTSIRKRTYRLSVAFKSVINTPLDVKNMYSDILLMTS